MDREKVVSCSPIYKKLKIWQTAWIEDRYKHNKGYCTAFIIIRIIKIICIEPFKTICKGLYMRKTKLKHITTTIKWHFGK